MYLRYDALPPQFRFLRSRAQFAGLFGGIGLFHLLARAYDTELYRWPVVIYPSKLVLAAVIMIAFISVAQLIIYRMIRKMNWLDVLKIKE